MPDLVDLSSLTPIGDVALRLAGAAVLGGVMGLEREWLQKPAGLRTPMLVALGSAMFVLAPREAGMNVADLSRVMQGVATGVGFIGAGTILKVASARRIEGLTTAASLWLAAAVGLTVGAGLWLVPCVSAVLALVILLSAGRGRHEAPGDGGISS